MQIWVSLNSRTRSNTGVLSLWFGGFVESQSPHPSLGCNEEIQKLHSGNWSVFCWVAWMTVALKPLVKRMEAQFTGKWGRVVLTKWALRLRVPTVSASIWGGFHSAGHRQSIRGHYPPSSAVQGGFGYISKLELLDHPRNLNQLRWQDFTVMSVIFLLHTMKRKAKIIKSNNLNTILRKD